MHVLAKNKGPKITIVGAGPAGSSLAIRLSKAGFEITLIEKEKFPRHKLCGEFISPECLTHFARLGVRDEMLARGGARIRTTRFFEQRGRSVEVPSSWFSEEAALSLSRAEMDSILLDRARSVGVDFIEAARVTSLCCDGRKVSAVQIKKADGRSEKIGSDVFIDATGRAAVLSRLLQRQVGQPLGPRSNRKAGYVGYKVHVRNARIEKDCCELYSFPGGYVGLSPVENGLANLCMLVKTGVARKAKSAADQIVSEVIFTNKRAHAILASAEPAGEWLAVALDGFGVKDIPPAANVFAVGDSAAFIDPFTGSGILMALESSELLAGLIVDAADIDTVAAAYQSAFRKRFATRLAISSILRRAAFTPAGANAAIALFASSRHLRRFWVRNTRGNLSFGQPNR